jgi:putative transcriptional regulator
MAKKSIGAGLLKGMQEALAHSKSELTLKETVREHIEPAPKWKVKDIKKLRQESFHLSQPEFAALLNVKLPTIRSWEQGQKSPSGSAARLLEILMKSPDVIRKLRKAG